MSEEWGCGEKPDRLSGGGQDAAGAIDADSTSVTARGGQEHEEAETEESRDLWFWLVFRLRPKSQWWGDDGKADAHRRGSSKASVGRGRLWQTVSPLPLRGNKVNWGEGVDGCPRPRVPIFLVKHYSRQRSLCGKWGLFFLRPEN